MKAVVYHGSLDVRVDTVPDPIIQDPRDIILKVSKSAICGSDLHLYDGYIPTMKSGDILGHEFMGEVVETGSAVHNVVKGDRAVIPFPIACGTCWFCKRELWSLCDNTNPNKELAEKAYGFSGAGIFGYSHMYGGYAGGQAEYVRVPYADVGAFKVPSGVSDEKALFLGDILPTGYMAAEQCQFKPGDTVAVWGCGPVGQFALLSAHILGAGRLIGIDRFEERLAMARQYAHAETINYESVDSVIETLKEMTGGRGPDACIDAVGMEAHGRGLLAAYDKAKQAVHLETDRPSALREIIQACRKGGTVSIPGVYGGIIDNVNIGAAFAKGLTFHMGQTHVHRFLPMLMKKIEAGEIDPSFIITHRLKLNDAPAGYKIFKKKIDNCIKIVMSPQ